MAAIAPDTIYTKTAKGILWSKTVQLSRERGLAFQAVDGKATVADLLSRLGLSGAELQEALDTLAADGYIKVIGHQVQRPGPDGETDLDFTSPMPARDDAMPFGSSADAQGSTNEPAQGEIDMAERVRELNARVQAERRAREEHTRRDMLGRNAEPAPQRSEDALPSLDLNVGPDAAQGNGAAQSAEFPSDTRPPPAEPPQTTPDRTGHRENELPRVDFDPAHELHTPEHVPTALELAMAAMAERAKAATPADASDASASPLPAAGAEGRSPSPAAAMPIIPSIEEDEPLHERVNVDRTAYDMLAESAEARRQAEVLQLGRDAEEARHRRIQEDARRRERAASEQRRRRALRWLAALAIGVPVAAIAWLQFMPLNGYVPQVQQALSESLGQPVTLSTLRYVLVPTPRLVFENVQIGKMQAVRADRVEARVLPFALWAREARYDRVDVFDIQIDAAALGAIPQWAGRRADGSVHVQRLSLTRVKLNVPGADLGVFDGEVAFDENGAVQQAVFANANARLELTPRAEGVRLALDATGWRVPYGPPLEFGRLVVNGLVDPSQVAAVEFTGRAAGGALDGALTARWGGPVTVQGEFNLQQARLEDLTAEFSREFPVRGVLKVSGRFSMQAPEWAALATGPHVQATFAVVRGELTTIDLVRAIQSPSSSALRGGRTAFDELGGVLDVTAGQYSYRQLQLRSGPLTASGSVTVTPGGQLNGRVTAQLGSRGGVVGRTALAIGGTARDPELKRWLLALQFR
jgi:hypothetical protein